MAGTPCQGLGAFLGDVLGLVFPHLLLEWWKEPK